MSNSLWSLSVAIAAEWSDTDIAPMAAANLISITDNIEAVPDKTCPKGKTMVIYPAVRSVLFVQPSDFGFQESSGWLNRHCTVGGEQFGHPVEEDYAVVKLPLRLSSSDRRETGRCPWTIFSLHFSYNSFVSVHDGHPPNSLRHMKFLSRLYSVIHRLNRLSDSATTRTSFCF